MNVLNISRNESLSAQRWKLVRITETNFKIL